MYVFKSNVDFIWGRFIGLESLGLHHFRILLLVLKFFQSVWFTTFLKVGFLPNKF